MSLPSPFLVKWLAQVKPGGTVLDLACGKGRHTRAALEARLHVTAVDINTSGLDDLKRHPGLEVIESDLEGAPWPLANRTFDALIVSNYLWRPLFPHIVQAVAPGGLLLYETFAVGNEKYGKPSNPDFLLEQLELKTAFHQDFEPLHFHEGYEGKPKPSIRQSFAGRRAA